MSRCFLLAFSSILYIILCIHPANAKPIILDRSLEKISAGYHLEYLEDKKGSLKIEDIKSEQFKGKWLKSNEENLNFGFTESVYWVRFIIKNETDKNLNFYLEYAYPLMDFIDLYSVEKNKKIKEVNMGLKYSFHQRPINFRTFVIPLEIEANNGITYYMRFKNAGPMQIDLFLWSPEKFQKYKDLETPFLWVVYGIMLIMFMYNLLLLFSIRDVSYLYCSLYIFFFGLLIMTLSGMSFQYLWPETGSRFKIFIPVFMGIINFSILQFGKYYINVKKILLDWKYIMNSFDKAVLLTIRIMILASISLSILTLITRNYHFGIISITGLSGINVTAGGAILVLGVVRYRSREAWLFLMAFLLFLIGILLFVMKTFGIFPDVFLTTYGMQIGGVLNVLFLSFALSDKINTMKKELQVLNLDLENKVIERTKELQVANRELSGMNETLVNLNDQLVESKRIARIDMDMAANVQASLFPKEAPQNSEWDIAFAYKPMSGVSGDMYDFYEEGGKLKGAALLDVSGHGIASGLITMITRSVFNRNFYNGYDIKLNEILEKANSDLINEMGMTDKYLTGIILRFGQDSIEYVNAAHPDILYRSGKNKNVKPVIHKKEHIRGTLLGMKEMATPYSELRFRIFKDDVIVMYTDCITDSKNHGKEQYGVESLSESLKNSGEGSAEDILEYILKDFYDFLDNKKPEDDLSVIVFKRLV